MWDERVTHLVLYDGVDERDPGTAALKAAAAAAGVAGGGERVFSPEEVTVGGDLARLCLLCRALLGMFYSCEPTPHGILEGKWTLGKHWPLLKTLPCPYR